KSGSNWRTPTSAAASIPEVVLVVSFACACKVVGRASAIAPAARSMAAPHEMCFMESLLVGSMLPVEIGTVRMVRAVDVEVTGGALAVEHELHVGRERGAARRDRMPAAGMALLAKPRTRHLQHLLVGRAVRVVAVRAAFDDGVVLPEVGTALLHVAGVAGLVGRARDEELLVRGAVRVVARRAFHFPLRDRHVRVVRLLRHLGRVAAGARRHHVVLLQVRALRFRMHHGVAVGAGHVAALVRASLPKRARRLLVALQAGGVALRNGRLRLLAEVDERAALLAAGLGVLLARSVTALASEPFLFVAG